MTTVFDTARWAAAYRAIETGRKDALFRDPYSERLAGPKGHAMVARGPRQVRNGWPVIARTNVIDEFVLEAVALGCDCVINLAAGFDTRPYRLTLPPSLSWVEADLPALIEEKEVLLEDARPQCSLSRHKLDLADDLARAAFLGHALKDKRKALILTEGLLMYLTEENVRSLAQDLHCSTVSWWIIEILSPPVLRAIMKRMKTELAKAPMYFAPANGVSFFEDLGWTVLDVRSLFHEAKRLRRLPWLLNVMARLPLREPDPRNVARAQWSGVARLGAGAIRK